MAPVVWNIGTKKMREQKKKKSNLMVDHLSLTFVPLASKKYFRVRINVSHSSIRDTLKRTCDSKKLKNNKIAIQKIFRKKKS